MEDRVIAILESLPDGFIALDADGRCTYVNGTAERLLGLSREEIVGRERSRWPPCRCAKAGWAAIDRAASERATASVEEHDEASDRWLETRACPDRNGGLSVYLRDVTDRVRAEQERLALEVRFARYMEHLPGLAWTKDLEGRYRYVNAAAARAFRRPTDEVLGHTDDELFPAPTAAQFRGNDRRALDSDQGVLVVETLEHEDGVLHHSLVSKFPVLDAEGRVTSVGGMAIDITDRIRAEEALRTADRRKDEFLAMLAHELRNPLAPLVTAAEIFRLRGAADPVLQRQCAVIGRQVQQMKHLLDDLLDISRITRGKIEFKTARIDLTAVLDEAVEMSRPFIDEREHALHVTLPESPLEAEGDAVRLAQVFANLLNNAAKFTPRAGQIWLTARRERETAHVSVRDTGIGMTPEVLAHAFDLFAQGDRTLDRGSGGLGIGLTLVWELVERHGGSVTAHSAGSDQGSELIVILPLVRSTGDTPSSQDHQPAREPECVPGGPGS